MNNGKLDVIEKKHNKGSNEIQFVFNSSATVCALIFSNRLIGIIHNSIFPDIHVR